jgi:hypothetical protein
MVKKQFKIQTLCSDVELVFLIALSVNITCVLHLYSTN